jgi:hypothetical protein
VAPRSRIQAFGSAAVLVAAGGACALLLGGLTGQVLAIALISLGLGGALLLLFLEVGLSEDRERARDEAKGARDEAERAGRRFDSQRPVEPRRRPAGHRPRRRPG